MPITVQAITDGAVLPTVNQIPTTRCAVSAIPQLVPTVLMERVILELCIVLNQASEFRPAATRAADATCQWQWRAAAAQLRVPAPWTSMTAIAAE